MRLFLPRSWHRTHRQWLLICPGMVAKPQYGLIIQSDGVVDGISDPCCKQKGGTSQQVEESVNAGLAAFSQSDFFQTLFAPVGKQ